MGALLQEAYHLEFLGSWLKYQKETSVLAAHVSRCPDGFVDSNSYFYLFFVIRRVSLLALQVVRFDEGATMPDRMFQIPDYCFEEEEEKDE